MCSKDCSSWLHGLLNLLCEFKICNQSHNNEKYVHTCDITCNAGCPSLYEMQYSNCGWLGGSAEDEQKTYTHDTIITITCKDAMY